MIEHSTKWQIAQYTPDPKTVCAFCKGAFADKYLITGPDGLNICLDCAELCAEIVSERKKGQREEAVKEMLRVEMAMEDSYQPADLMYRLYDAGFRQMHNGRANG
jgi:ATP-dependent Clp protease ATP-binding subunit ClpX